MIILVMIVFALATFLSWFMIKNSMLSKVLGSIFIILLAATVAITTLNFTQHFGMKTETKTTVKQVYSASPASPANTLITKRIGTKANNYVLIYRNDDDAKKATTHGIPDTSDISKAVKIKHIYRIADVKKATVKTTTTRWIWKNDFWRILFGVGGQGNELKKQTSVVTVPKKTWVVMTANQAKALAAAQKKTTPEATAAGQAQLKTAIEAKVGAFMKTNPTADEDQVKAYTTEITSEMTASMMKQTLANLK